MTAENNPETGQQAKKFGRGKFLKGAALVAAGVTTGLATAAVLGKNRGSKAEAQGNPEVKENHTPYGRVKTEQYIDFFHQEFRQDIPHDLWNMWLGQFSGVTVQPQEEPTIMAEGREVTHLWNTSFQKLAQERHNGAISTMALGLTKLNDGSLEVEVIRAENMQIDGQPNPGAHFSQIWESEDGVEWRLNRYNDQRAIDGSHKEQLLAIDQALEKYLPRV